MSILREVSDKRQVSGQSQVSGRTPRSQVSHLTTSVVETKGVTKKQGDQDKRSATERTESHEEGQVTSEDEEQDVGEGEAGPIYVRLWQAVWLLPCPSKAVMDAECCQDPLLLEPRPRIEDDIGLQVEDTVFTPSLDGVACVIVTNYSGFTQVAEEGDKLGEVTVIPTSRNQMHSHGSSGAQPENVG